MTGCPKGREPLRNSDPSVTVLLKSIELKRINDVGVVNTDKTLLELVPLGRVPQGLLDVDLLAEVDRQATLDVLVPERDHHPGHLEVEVELTVLASAGKRLRLVFVLIS